MPIDTFKDVKDQEADGPLPTTEDVLLCQISSWYPHFARLPKNNKLQRKKGTIRTILIDVTAATSKNNNDDVFAVTASSGSCDDDNGDKYFRDYLLADGVRLPTGCQTSSLLSSYPVGGLDKWSSDEDEDEDGQDEDDDSNKSSKQNEDESLFPELLVLTTKIAEGIESLGGSVVPKLNWSCPKDAVWVNGGTLQCTTPGDVYLLLKSSDFCMYDLQHALSDVVVDGNSTNDDGNDRNYHDEKQSSKANKEASNNSGHTAHRRLPSLTLALRKWCNLHPSQEFRCFVYQNRLIACSQRNHTQYFPHLREDRRIICRLLYVFFRDIILFVSTAAASAAVGDDDEDCATSLDHKQRRLLPNNYSFDAYIDQQQKVWLVDINVWGQRTDSLLFTWKELQKLCCSHGENAVQADAIEEENDLESDEYADESSEDDDVDDDDDLPILRIVETPKQVRHDPLASYRAPVDTLHVAGMTKGPCNDSHNEGNNPINEEVGDEGFVGTKNFEGFMKLCERPSVLQAEKAKEEDKCDNCS